MKRNVFILLAVAVLAGFAIYKNNDSSVKEAVAAQIPGETAPRADYLAPAFTLQGMDGQTYQVGGKRDKALLLNFWASWCGPCEIEAPDLKKMYDKYGAKLDIYAVNMTKNDNLNDAKDFVKQFGLQFPVLMDKEGKMSDLYRFQYLPTSFLIDKDGVVREMIHLLDSKELERKVKNLIEG